MSEIEDVIEDLAEAGLLTDRQAEAYVAREIEAVPRPATADKMGISVNRVDNLLRAARDKVEAARETIDVIDSYRWESIPSECDECGETIGAQWAQADDGTVYCPDCSGVVEEFERLRSEGI